MSEGRGTDHPFQIFGHPSLPKNLYSFTPMPNAGAYFTALQAAKIPSEMHMFEAGGHGFGIARTVDRPTAIWPDLLVHWGASHGFFKGTA